MNRLLILLFIFSSFLFAQCSNTSYANGAVCVQQATIQNPGTGTSATATFGSSVAGKAVLVAAIICDDVSCTKSGLSGVSATVQSGGGDTFEAAALNPYESNAPTVDVRMWAWVVPVANAGTTFTVNCSPSCFYASLKVSAWTGLATSSVFDVGAGGSSASAGTSASISAGTTTNATDLIYGVIANDNGTLVTPGSGFTEIGEGNNGWEHEAKTVTSAGAQSCTWTFASSDNYDGLCLALKLASGGGGGGGTSVRRGFIIK